MLFVCPGFCSQQLPIATPEQKAAVETAAQAVLDVRAAHQTPSPSGEGRGGATLAQLYDPAKMPADLLGAHLVLDRAVDACYGIKQAFGSEAKRVAWLFERYGELVRK